MPDGKKKEKVKVIWSPFAMLFMNNYSRQSVSTMGLKSLSFTIFALLEFYKITSFEAFYILHCKIDMEIHFHTLESLFLCQSYDADNKKLQNSNHIK